MGAGVALLGLAATGFGAETIATMRVGVPLDVGPYEAVIDSVSQRAVANYDEVVAMMTLRSHGQTVAVIEPARRQFPARQMATTQAGIATLDFGQVYVAVGDPNADGTVPTRLYWKPLVTLIWLGACLMALGGALLAHRQASALRRAGARRNPPPPRRLWRRDDDENAPRRPRLRAAPAAGAVAHAVQPDEVLADPALEARARDLSAELRCLVCQNQSIDDSDARRWRTISGC